MPAADVIFCERTGVWAVAWRQAWQAASQGVARPKLRLVESRGTDECRATLAASPGALVVVELTPQRCDDGLELVRHIGESFPMAVTGVVAERGMAAYQWLARELGAVDFVTSPRRLSGLCNLAARHAARRGPSPLSLSERIWADLPWPDGWRE